MSSGTALSSGHTLEVLDSGVRLIVAPLKERHSVGVAMMFRVGSRYEPAPLAGVSHFLEHMVFKGSAAFPTAKDVAEAIEGIGGELNASTDKEMTVFWARVPAGHLDRAVEVLADIIRRPKLEAAEMEKERSVILEELRMYRDSPADHVHTVFEEALWPDHPLGVDIAGTEASVGQITRDALSSHLEGHYRASSLVVTVAGSVEPAEAAAVMDSRLSGWPGGEASGYPPALPLPEASAVRLVRRETEQAHIVFGTRCISYLDPDRFSIDLMSTVLGAGMSCRLFLEVRERLGLCYDVHSWAAKLADSGAAGVYIGTDPNKAVPAVEAVMVELHRMCEEPVGNAELTKAREYLKGRLLLRLESSGAVASFLGEQELLTRTIIEPEEIVARIDAVTADDVMKVARQTYAEQQLRMAVVGPFEDGGAFADLLRWT